jgi:metal-responsive CopG/Arc/MetJ family transcriptional regulator
MSVTTGTGTEKAKAGTPVRMRMPPKLLARVDALVAAQPEPKPTRGKVIKELMREALSARRARRRARQASAGGPKGAAAKGA